MCLCPLARKSERALPPLTLAIFRSTLQHLDFHSHAHSPFLLPPSASIALHRMASMKRPTSSVPHLLSDNPSRIAHLKKIKHDLTGHVSRKAESLNNGLIPLLADLLHKSQHHDQVYAHVAQILSILAHGRFLDAANCLPAHEVHFQKVYLLSNNFSTPTSCPPSSPFYDLPHPQNLPSLS